MSEATNPTVPHAFVPGKRYPRWCALCDEDPNTYVHASAEEREAFDISERLNGRGAEPEPMPVLTLAVPGAPATCPRCGLGQVKWPLAAWAMRIYLECPRCHERIAQLAADRED